MADQTLLLVQVFFGLLSYYPAPPRVFGYPPLIAAIRLTVGQDRGMDTRELLTDSFGRIRTIVASAVQGLTAEQLAYRPDPEANSVGWLVWHLIRVQDDHVAEVAGTEQVWTAQGWVDRFGLPFDRYATGYGQSPEDVAAVRVDSPETLTGYLDAVLEATERFVSTVGDGDLDRVVDERWDPPVTLAVRLISVLSDDLQHAGQAAYLRGLVTRRSA
jgi:hypothetical protein